MTLAPGTRIRNFVLTERIGRGGMGEVWKATLDIVGKPIAVKFILADRLDTKLEARFLKEAMTMARLDHDRIVPLNDFFAVDGVFALVMPYIEGVPLANVIEAAPQGMPLQDAMSISLQILSGLDYAHDIGIVHRDIKSTNVLVTKSGKAWLMDFGISKAMGERGLTQTGTAIGTVSYMSPEQIKFPAKVDRRADIYSFGVMLYEMLTGHLPFDDPDGDSGSAYIVQTAHCIQPPPPLRTWNPDIPQDLEMIVLRSLEKEPDQRYQTCAEFALTLQNYSQNSQNGFRGGLRPEVGADLEKDLSINFWQSIEGAQIPLNLVREMTCKACHGSGQSQLSPCVECGGKGRFMQPDSVPVQVPKGVRPGTRLRITGKGSAGIAGGAAGDLFVTILVEENTVFKREGDDIHTKVSLTSSQAKQGATIQTPTIHGAASLNIPAGTQSGQKFRLPEMGVLNETGNARGHHYTEVAFDSTIATGAPNTPVTSKPEAASGLPGGPPRSRLGWLLVGIALFALLAAGTVFFWNRHPSPSQPPVSGTVAPPNNPIPNSPCGNDKDCLKNDTTGRKLLAIADWNKVQYDDPILKNCMGFSPCVDAAAEVAKIEAFHFDKASRLTPPSHQCHGWAACVDYFKSQPPGKTSNSPSTCPAFEDLVSCCNNAENPAACRKCKRDVYHEKDECDPTPYDH